ncbi:hypothetical protein T265_09999 [Opisthorchis viverrini]|uniref:Uncharacterized protein n=1 Tax=Opisthorchis viverrini TaxID=6198 RepID=A0A074Z879_OPIVI|nr:hypothetical protein T265_09999 [Opisthorchis viverrini]KER21762.1 hypothetical protein T265_09999 [Opisthorchis viverrini]
MFLETLQQPTTAFVLLRAHQLVECSAHKTENRSEANCGSSQNRFAFSSRFIIITTSLVSLCRISADIVDFRAQDSDRLSVV